MNQVWNKMNFHMEYIHYAPIEYDLKRAIEQYFFEPFQPADNFGIYGLVSSEVVYETIS